jgi:hypothetical protein
MASTVCATIWSTAARPISTLARLGSPFAPSQAPARAPREAVLPHEARVDRQ